MDLLIFAFIILAMFGFLFYRYLQKKANKNPYQAELLKKCAGDKDKMNRLIHFELNRHPRISKKKATKFALESLIKDR